MSAEIRPTFPTVEQVREQMSRYGLSGDPQAVPVAMRLIAAGALVERAAEAHFAEFGLSSGRYRLLVDLEDVGGEKSPSELAESLGVTRATITGLVDGLEKEGLVCRRRNPSDGRGLVVVLTAKGANKLRSMAADHFRWLELLVSGLSETDRAVFLELIDRFFAVIPALAGGHDRTK